MNTFKKVKFNKNLLSNKTTQIGLLILIISLPIIVWAYLNQRFILQKRAASTTQPIVIRNTASGLSCDQICEGSSMTCRSIGTSDGGDNYIYRKDSSGICVNQDIYSPNNSRAGCDIAMTDSGITDTSWPDGRKCLWTNCLCGPATNDVYYLISMSGTLDINMPVSQPNENYGIGVVLYNDGNVVTNQQGFTYHWSIDDSTLATLTPFAPSPANGEPCDTFGVQQPCPQSHAMIHALKTGNSQIHVSVSNANTTIANFTFNLTVLPVASRNIKIRVKLAGVTDNSAQNTTMSVRFLNNNLDLAITPVPTLNFVGNGIYEANINIPESQLPAISGYRVIVKGEKHLGRKFCKITGQTTPCNFTDSITITNSNTPIPFDFTGMPLDPGDIAPQNGTANNEDFQKIFNQMSSSCGTTTSDYKAADLNYSGCVNSLDALLMRKTLENRYDDN